MADLVGLHRRAVEGFDTRVQAIRDDQWQSPTPCDGWDVRALVNHLVNEDLWTKPLMEGRTIAEVGDEFEGDLLGDDPKTAWAEARDEAHTAVAAPGALERTVHVSWGEIPAREYVMQLLNDHLIHSWDLARGTGGDDSLDPELVELCYEWAEPQEELIRRSGVFGDRVDVAPDADLQTRLLAIMGRRAST